MVRNIFKVLLSLALVTSANACWVLARLLWFKAKDQWCMAKTGEKTYQTVADAQAACASAGADWTGVYDDGWDGGEAYVCKGDSISDPDSDGWVIKPASTKAFQPKALKRAVSNFLGLNPTGNTPKWGTEAELPSSWWFSSYKFQQLDISDPYIGFDDLHGSVIYAVRRMGWKLCREGAMQITQAAKELNQKNLRLVAIVKERAGWEEFTRDYWPSPAEIYFDTYEPDFPFFAAANGKKQGVVGMLVSGMFGGEVANNLKRAQHIAGNSDGDDSILGSVVVVSSKGEVLFLHKENVPGDHPNDEKMRDAMQVAVEQLGGTGVVSCECDEDKKID